MTTTMRLLPVRVSADLRGLIDQVGPVNPAVRALLLLGADAAGLDLGGLDREIAGLLAAPLDAEVQARLRDLFGRVTTSDLHGEPEPPLRAYETRSAALPVEAEDTTDPFARVGIDV
jgi:hypothetical protein